MEFNAILIGIAVWYFIGLGHLIYLLYKEGWKIGPPLIMRNLPRHERLSHWFALILVGPFMIHLLDESETIRTLYKSKET